MEKVTFFRQMKVGSRDASLVIDLLGKIPSEISDFMLYPRPPPPPINLSSRSLELPCNALTGHRQANPIRP